MIKELVPSKNGGQIASLPIEKSEQAVLVLEPGREKFSATIPELWRYRELFYFLAWRDISVKYKQTLLGVSWVIFQPFVSMVVFTIVFGHLVGIQSDNIPYPLFVLSGIVPWTFFAAAINRSGDSLVNNASLITKVYFPRLIVPSASALAGVLDFVVSLLVLFIMMFYYKYLPGLEILAIPLLALLMLFLAVSVGLFFSATNVRYRDVRFVTGYIVSIWMYASPVIYPYSIIPEKYRTIAMLNPMVGVIEGFRWALLKQPFPAMPLLSSCLFAIVVFLLAQNYFRRVERTFADVVLS